MTSKVQPLQIIESLTSKIIELLTEKTWAQGCVIQQREKWPRVEFTSLSEDNILNEYSASVDNTLLDLQNSSYPSQPHSIIANYCIHFSSFHFRLPEGEKDLNGFSRVQVKGSRGGTFKSKSNVFIICIRDLTANLQMFK